MPSRSPPGSARPRSSARASSSSKISSIGCCNNGSVRKRSAPRSRSSQPAVALETLAQQADLARDAGQKAAAELAQLLQELASAREQRARAERGAQRAARPLAAGARRCRCPPRLCSRRHSVRLPGKSPQWLKSSHSISKPRAAQQLRVEHGWERAVETVLGSYLEAVCVDEPGFGHGCAGELRRRSSGGRERGLPRRPGPDPASLRAKVAGAPYLASVLGPVFTAETLDPRRCACSRGLGAGQSVVTRDGVWLGADWLRLSRDPEPHTGVIEREEIAARAARGSRAASRRKSRSAEQRARADAASECATARIGASGLQTGSEPAAPRARRPARGARLGASAQGGCCERRLSQLETALADVTRRARAHRDRSARGARAAWKPPSTRSRRSSRSGSSSRASASGCAPSRTRRARPRRRRSSGRANWRCRWSRAAPRMPRWRRRSRASRNS